MLFVSFSSLSWPLISSRQCVSWSPGPRHSLAVVPAARVASVQVDEIGMAAAISVCERGHVWQQPLGWAILHMSCGSLEVLGQQQWLIRDIGDIYMSIWRHGFWYLNIPNNISSQSIFAGTNPFCKQHFYMPSRDEQRRCQELKGGRQPSFPPNFGDSHCLHYWLMFSTLSFHDKNHALGCFWTRQHFLLLSPWSDPWRC